MQIKQKKNRGFTLIELLVVISIIGLLSAIILASLSSAKQKSKDAAVTSEMLEMRNFMELNRDATGGFAAVFTAFAGAVSVVGPTSGAYYYPFTTTGQCSAVSGYAQFTSICTAIINDGSTVLVGGPSSTWSTHPTYSVVVQTPSNQLYSCAGSGGSNVSGKSSNDYYSYSGCLANP